MQREYAKRSFIEAGSPLILLTTKGKWRWRDSAAFDRIHNEAVRYTVEWLKVYQGEIHHFEGLFFAVAQLLHSA